MKIILIWFISLIAILLGVLFAIVKILEFIGRKFVTPLLMVKAMICRPADFQGFDTTLNIPNCVLEDSIHFDKKVLSVDYRIPTTVCLFDSIDKLYYLGLGGVLALADQLTSILIIAKDKSHRIGVSIHLSGSVTVDLSEFKQAMQPGNFIRLEASISKIGMNLAFSKLSVFTQDKLIATVTHIKYLNLGFIMNLISPALPGYYTLMRRFFTSTYQKQLENIRSFAPHFPSPSTQTKHPISLPKDVCLEGVISLSILKPPSLLVVPFSHPSSSSLKSPSPLSSTSSSSSLSLSSSPSGWEEQEGVWGLRVHSLLMNPYHFLHGGAISCAVESIALKDIRGRGKKQEQGEDTEDSTGVGVGARSIEIEFLSPCKGNLSLLRALHSPHLNLSNNPSIEVNSSSSLSSSPTYLHPHHCTVTIKPNLDLDLKEKDNNNHKKEKKTKNNKKKDQVLVTATILYDFEEKE